MLLCLSAASTAAVAPGPEVTQCQSWPASHDGKAAVAVSCCAPGGKLIECCGHGLLAAAWYWQKEWQCDELLLLMNNTPVPSWREQTLTWLRFSRMPTQASTVPEWVVQLFPGQLQPLAAAICGDERGYLVLQWPDDFNLKMLAPRLGVLSQFSRRAMICTAAQPAAGLCDIQLRYFAPQYGVDEDTATGSAMRILADYWSSRFTRLTARQCSPLGGLLFARSEAAHVEVGGRCVSAVLEAPDG